jgi:hypothetical protein
MDGEVLKLHYRVATLNERAYDSVSCKDFSVHRPDGELHGQASPGARAVWSDDPAASKV